MKTFALLMLLVTGLFTIQVAPKKALEAQGVSAEAEYASLLEAPPLAAELQGRTAELQEQLMADGIVTVYPLWKPTLPVGVWGLNWADIPPYTCTVHDMSSGWYFCPPGNIHCDLTVHLKRNLADGSTETKNVYWQKECDNWPIAKVELIGNEPALVMSLLARPSE